MNVTPHPTAIRSPVVDRVETVSKPLEAWKVIASSVVGVAAATAVAVTYAEGLATKADLEPISKGLETLRGTVEALGERENRRYDAAAQESDCLVDRMEFSRRMEIWGNDSSREPPAKSDALLRCEKEREKRINGL